MKRTFHLDFHDSNSPFQSAGYLNGDAGTALTSGPDLQELEVSLSTKFSPIHPSTKRLFPFLEGWFFAPFFTELPCQSICFTDTPPTLSVPIASSVLRHHFFDVIKWTSYSFELSASVQFLSILSRPRKMKRNCVFQ